MSKAVLQRIKAFEDVQAIPYRFDFINRHLDASCFSKAQKLVHVLTGFGLAARPICCRCRWDENGLPPHLLRAALSEETQHFFVQVHIPETGRWANVDPTFERGLRAAGFVAPDWDGLSSTPLAMTPFAFFDAEQSRAISEMKCRVDPEDLQGFIEIFGDFYAGLNGWIDGQRNAPTGRQASKLEGRHYA